MIPFGPWHPDRSGINVEAVREAWNCLPAVNGYRPLASPAPATDELTGACLGAAVIIDNEGMAHTFAGDATKLYKLGNDAGWDNVSRVSGTPYSAGGSERWQFAATGQLIIATNQIDEMQKFNVTSSTNFEPLGGTPPRARYVATVRDFVFAGGIFEDELTVKWSGLANPEHWTAGTQNSGYQTFQDGGPVRGLIGGEVVYIFQANKLTRGVFEPGSDNVFRFDEVEGGRGLASPYSLVRVGSKAYYLSADGPYELDLNAGVSRPIGVGKWAQFFVGDIKGGLENLTIGGADPVRHLVAWSYAATDSNYNTRNRTLFYDWTLEEAVPCDAFDVEALAQVLTLGTTIDTMDAFGTMETLPFSLDSPFWAGGASLLGIFGPNGSRAMQVLSGPPLEARWVTNDGEDGRRRLIKGARPHVDTRAITAEVAAREAEGDAVGWGPVEVMEDTGIISTWASGWLARVRLRIPAGTTWTKLTGLDAVEGPIGAR